MAPRRAIGEGFLRGLRIVTAGATLSTIGGHEDTHGFRPEAMDALGGDNICTCIDQCAGRVRRTVRDGADLSKFHATGGKLSQGDKSLDRGFSPTLR